MSEPTPDIDAALRQIETRWDEQRSERTLAGAYDKRRVRGRRKQKRIIGAVALAAVACAGLVGLLVMRATTTVTATTTTTPTTTTTAATTSASSSAGQAGSVQAMQLADGSQVALLDRETRVVVKEVSASVMSLELSSGHARFEVTHRAGRRFRVAAGEVAVEVLGTVFELERDGSRTRVVVERGRVAVEWSDGRSELRAGEAGWFPKAEAPQKPHVASGQASWREPAEHGDFKHAYELLAAQKHSALDDVEELMLAADTARLSGHPDAALPFLNQVVARHAGDARAPLAAFTLGGILMQQLARPAEAELAYGKARALAPNSSLAQDALARQVEAAHRAGDAARASALAAEYLAHYPNGRRVHAVRRFAGLDSE